MEKERNHETWDTHRDKSRTEPHDSGTPRRLHFKRANNQYVQEIRRSIMYYRVAIQVDASSIWQWRSTVLSSLDALFQLLRLYRAVPQDRLRVFSCSSREGMIEQLVRVNQGLLSTSVTAAQFMHDRMIGSPDVGWGASAVGIQGTSRTTSIPVFTE